MREISFLMDWCKTHSPLAGGAAPTTTTIGIYSSNWQHMLQQLDNLASHKQQFNLMPV